MSLALGSESAADRVLALRMRPDLEVRSQGIGGDRTWAVKDPVSLKYFHLCDEEYTVLTMLDGRTSPEEIRRHCDNVFAPHRLSVAQLHGFVATLHRYGLVLAESPGQGEQLLTRHQTQRRHRRYQSLLGLLAIRFPGVNPSRFLDWLYPKTAWLFSPVCVGAVLLLGIAALVLVAVEFQAFLARLPDFRAIVAASNLPWLVVALAVTKILHELGHALACRHFGGDCHEIGVMLLVFTPCLYCNVSDSWMLASKWRRAAIAAAGMYVELILASVCTFLWWFSEPGLFNSLCLNTMLVCSIGTVVLNGNPLLRYDGYFILSDLVDVPNLSTQATDAVRRIAARWCLGMEVGSDRATPAGRLGLLVAYAVAATVYRWIVVVAVLWALNQMARPYRLEPLVVLLACVTVGGMVAPMIVAAVGFVRDPAHARRIARTRAAVSAVVVASVVLLVAMVPMPMRVAAPVVAEYRDAQRVYVTVSGTLRESVHNGDAVRKGETLAQLDNASVALEIAKLTSERDQQRLFLANLESRRLQGVVDGAQIPTAQTALADIEERLEQLERDAARLTIVAPLDGTVLPPPNLPRPTAAGDKLERWSGTPLDERNSGTFLDTGTLLCLVGDPDRMEAVLHVEQSDIELVARGQAARIVLDHLPGQVFWGKVVEIAKLDLKVMPRELAAAGDLPSRTDERGVSHPLDTWYQARVVFDDDPPHLVARVHGRASIVAAPQSLGAQLSRYLKQTFSR